MVGNRRLFTQSKNPWIRSLGQFLSWAQAKTAQTNSLIERIEDGDVALALRGLSLTGIYAGVQYLREGFKPTGEFRLPDDEKGQKIASYDETTVEPSLPNRCCSSS